MPGKLGYRTSRNITLYGHAEFDPARAGPGAAPDQNKTIRFTVDRELANLDYAHIRSVVDYNERFTFNTEDEDVLNENVTVYNHGALSTWHQLNHRPDFAQAFKAVSELKKRFR
jgi:hypothetical protein